MKILSKLLLIAILALLGNTTLYAERINMKEAGADTNGNHPKLNARLIKEKGS